MLKRMKKETTMKRTTVNLPEELWIEAKVRAARERKDAQDVLRDALEAWLRPRKGGRDAR
jgi:Arc/MetJ-type ribon-helix-helix transcriptional regulator